jgi:hypothetical protein
VGAILNEFNSTASILGSTVIFNTLVYSPYLSIIGKKQQQNMPVVGVC